MAVGLKILYVEDDMVISEIVKMTLEDIGGFTVDHSSSGKEALSKLKNGDYDLALMDVMMPEMDGVQTMKVIHSLKKWSALPVIFMTAKTQTHEQEAYIQDGAIGVIPKPFDPETLCDTIVQMYERSLL